jgi:dihydrofolate synthase/folylpolyglutamate synthase
MRAGRPVDRQRPGAAAEPVDRAREVGADLWRFGRDFNYAGDKQQWRWAARASASAAWPTRRCAAPTSCSTRRRAGRVRGAARRCRSPRRRCAAASRWSSCRALPDRAGQPTLVLDVAHNPHAVATLAQNLDQMGFFPRTHAVFGAMQDKDLEAILRAWRRSSTRGTSPTCRCRGASRGRLRRCTTPGAAGPGRSTVAHASRRPRAARASAQRPR